MYTKLRSLHLFLGLLMSAFLFAYGASAFMMAHSLAFGWAYPKPQGRQIAVDLPPQPKLIIDKIRAQEDLHGDLIDVKTSSLAVRFIVERPGTRYEVGYDLRKKTADIITLEGGIWYTLDRLHHTGGIYHDTPELRAWGWVVFIASILTVIVGLTGVLLWFQRNKERRVGGMIFIISFIFAGGLLFLVRVL